MVETIATGGTVASILHAPEAWSHVLRNLLGFLNLKVVVIVMVESASSAGLAIRVAGAGKFYKHGCHILPH